MKRFISLIMVFVLSVTFCTTALAAETKNVSSALVEDSFETVTEESDNSQEWYYGDNLDSDDIQTAINQDIPETAAAVNDDVTYVTYEPPKTLEFSGVFNRPNEKHTYKIEIDHSLYPDPESVKLNKQKQNRYIIHKNRTRMYQKHVIKTQSA